MRHPDHVLDAPTPPVRHCPTCRAPISLRRHVIEIAGDVILDCPTCWTTTIFDRVGRVVRRVAR